MDTIKQKRLDLTLHSGRRVQVRRATWKAAREILVEISVHLRQHAPSGAPAAGINVLKQLEDIVQSIDALAARLLLATTDLGREGVDSLDVAELPELLAASIEINFGAEVKNYWAGVGNALSALIGSAPTPTSPGENSMRGLSMPAMDPTTSTAAP